LFVFGVTVKLAAMFTFPPDEDLADHNQTPTTSPSTMLIPANLTVTPSNMTIPANLTPTPANLTITFARCALTVPHHSMTFISELCGRNKIPRSIAVNRRYFKTYLCSKNSV